MIPIIFRTVDKIFRFVQNPYYCLNGFGLRQHTLTGDMIDLTVFPLIDNQIEGTAVIRYIEPAVYGFSVCFWNYRFFSQCFPDNCKREFILAAIRPIVFGTS